MKLSRRPTLGIKHLPFFEALAECEEPSPRGHSVKAGLLLLRLIDNWQLAGPVMVEPESVSVRAVREALMDLEGRDPDREVLLGMMNAMQTVREVDVHILLPRLVAYGELLQQRAELMLAVDVYGTIIRLADEAYDGDLLVECLLSLAYCQRLLGVLADAEVSYTAVGKLARRRKDVAAKMRSHIGFGVVAMMRGNLPKAEEILAQVAIDSAQAGCRPEHARALHVRAAVALRRGATASAVRLGYEALQLTEGSNERDLILGDIGAYLIVMERYDAARDALLVLDATAATEVVRLNARVNMVALAARAGDERFFHAARAQIEKVALPAEARVNFLIESARGFREFGEHDAAAASLHEARVLATSMNLNRSVFEVDAMLAAPTHAAPATQNDTRVLDSDVVADVEHELRKMALAVA
jgi:tetratricopeptide (TPR) repeat protein